MEPQDVGSTPRNKKMLPVLQTAPFERSAVRWVRQWGEKADFSQKVRKQRLREAEGWAISRLCCRRALCPSNGWDLGDTCTAFCFLSRLNRRFQVPWSAAFPFGCLSIGNCRVFFFHIRPSFTQEKNSCPYSIRKFENPNRKLPVWPPCHVFRVLNW